jgi:hypothetical protein
VSVERASVRSYAAAILAISVAGCSFFVPDLASSVDHARELETKCGMREAESERRAVAPEIAEQVAEARMARSCAFAGRGFT